MIEPQIVSMRGRDPEHPTGRKPQNPNNPFEQRLEINEAGLANALTTVQKDNLVLIPITTGGRPIDVASTILAGYERTNMTGFNGDNAVCVGIRQATEKGYVSCELGGVADLSYPDSKSRRGRVQEGGTVCPTLLAGDSDIYRIESIHKHQQDNLMTEDGLCITQCAGLSGRYNIMQETKGMQYRIRKLTPKECFRLMGVRDEDSDKLTVSNSQKYKQAGNSIVCDVLMAIFENMFINDCEENTLF